MSDKILIAFRGRCGLSIDSYRDEEKGRIYTSEGCPNPKVVRGTAPESFRKYCAECPDAAFKEGSQKARPTLTAGPSSVTAPQGTPPQQKQQTTPAAPAKEDKTMPLPTDLPPPGGSPPASAEPAVQPEPAATMPAPAAAAPAVQQTPEGLPLPVNVPPPGTPVVASDGNPNDSGLVQGTVAGPPNEKGQIPVNYPGNEGLPPVMENPEDIQVDQQGAAPIVTQQMPTPAATQIVVPQPPYQQQQPQPQPTVQQAQAALPTNVAPPAQAQAVQPEGTFLPGMNLEGLTDESAVDVDAVLASIEGIDGGPSTGGFSWHNLEAAEACWRRAFFEMVLGLRKKIVSPALQLGSLVHACFELHYKSGGMRTFEPCDAVARAGAVELAGDARRFVYGQLQKYGQEEASTWDIRGVELQGTWFMPPEKIGNKTVHLPLTCRHDLVTALRAPGGPCHPPGQPVPGGVHIVDFKTAKAMSYDLTKGYGMDGQFLMNALIYQQAEAATMGPLAGVIVSIIAKHKKLDPTKSFFRVHTVADEGSVAEFYHDEARPWALELYRRLKEKSIRGDMSKWPKCRASCVGQYGPCFFFDICDSPPGSEEAIIADMYKQQPERVKNLDAFLQPSADHKRVAGKTPEQVQAAEEKKSAAKSEREELKALVLNAFLNGVSQYPQFQPASQLLPDRKVKDVRAALAGELQAAWSVGTRFQLALSANPDDTVTMTITTKGFNWSARGKRGSWTFKSMAVELSRDWWDATKHQPSSAEGSNGVNEQAQPVPTGPMAAPQPPQQ